MKNPESHRAITTEQDTSRERKLLHGRGKRFFGLFSRKQTPTSDQEYEKRTIEAFATFPEIYDCPDPREMADAISEKLNLLPDSVMAEIYRRSVGAVQNKENYRRRDAEICDLLTDILGLKTRPKIIYKDGKDRACHGGYFDGTITLYNRFDALKLDTEEANEANLKSAATLAHEIWHAYQHQEAKEKKTKRGKLYNVNINYYKDVKKYGKEAYSKQLVELEADVFGKEFSARLATAANKK